MMWGYGGLNWLWMMPAMLVFWAIAIGLIVWAVRATTGSGPDGDPALQTLRQRLASGEITRDECEQMEHALTR